ncbi:MAG: hypothetical protein HY820_38705 [Acidobacteria bacterium]|nr:hypothetical protein [Acidobacteriota bacterium]
MKQSGQPWLYSAAADGPLLLAPAFVVTLLVLLLPREMAESKAPPWIWLALVVGVDVAHVYSTIYRTYLDEAARKKYASLLVLIPLACWAAGVMLYSAGSLVFWRVLAYLAVFHFVRQQYGFLRLYSRYEEADGWHRRLDAAAIYMATLYPLIYWHTHPRAFHWFIEKDFGSLAAPWLSTVAGAVYAAALAAYVYKEARQFHRTRFLNIPKHLILAGTALSWYVGIVLCNGDLAFTVTNVVAHGVPYMALVWIYQRKRAERVRTAPAFWFRTRMIPLYMGLLLSLAYVEEAFWDVLVWRDHTQFFRWLSSLPQLEDATLAIGVPLLAVPQAAHYVLDGFLWRVKDSR